MKEFSYHRWDKRRETGMLTTGQLAGGEPQHGLKVFAVWDSTVGPTDEVVFLVVCFLFLMIGCYRLLHIHI